jgi:predicted nucleic acid-binding protein
MKLLDANLLIQAVNRDSPLHAKAKIWLEKILVEDGFFAIPLSTKRAFDVVDEWLHQPAARVVESGRPHFSIPRELLTPLGAAGNRPSDVHLAALAIEQNAHLYSCDNNLARFQGLRWKNPLADRSVL